MSEKIEEHNIYEEETVTEKVVKWFRSNITIIVLLLISVGYIIFGLVDVTKSGKSVYEIIAEGFISFGLGVAITTLLGLNGIKSGLATTSYLEELNKYGKTVEIATNKIEKLDSWCDSKREQVIKRKQTNILRPYLLDYGKFLKGDYVDAPNLTKQQKKALKRAYKVKVYGLSANELMSDANDDEMSDRPYQTISKYNKKRFTSTLTSKALYALIFGYFAVSMIEPNIANMIWHAFQVIMWITLGFMEYMTRYTFITTTYTNQLRRKRAYLDEFNIIIQ